jgi:hypothetical protein
MRASTNALLAIKKTSFQNKEKNNTEGGFQIPK